MGLIAIESLDHLVLTVRDTAAAVRFYESLGFTHRLFNGGRHALYSGSIKINLHEAGREFEPKAALPAPGSADICLITKGSARDTLDELAKQGIPVLLGPVARSGAVCPIESVYVRDPDGNLIEISSRAA